MLVELSGREAALVMASLRCWQDMAASYKLEDEYEAYFETHEPLSNEEIDSVCQRIAEAAVRSSRTTDEP
jgi:hypothetical protein